jgi:hypothetical protein
MTLISTARHGARRWRRRRHHHLIPILLGSVIAAAAIALIAYLLRPAWDSDKPADKVRLPISVGETLFNVPVHAIRVKLQKHSGPQERVDLSFLYPSLEAPDPAKHRSANSVEGVIQPLDRIFVSISAHHDTLAPDIRSRTIYPRYLEPSSPPAQDGLATRTFRNGSPYSNEDLFSANTPSLVARCTRDGVTAGMCLSERRIEGADLTFRFPRGWLAQWREVAGAMDRLTAQLHGPKS